MNWQAYVEARGRLEVIIFQVWRPLNDNCSSYRLVDSHRVDNYNVGQDLLINSTALTPMRVEPGDVVGVYLNKGGSNRNIGVQQYQTDSSRVFFKTNPDQIGSVLRTCESTDTVIGAPIVNAVVIIDGKLILYCV